MIHPTKRALAVATLAGALLATPSLADEPGGVTVQKAPVTGEEVYRQICQSCHMPNAMGGAGAAVIPALAKNPNLGSAEYLVTTVAKGRGAMPWFDDTLSPAQIAAVATYVRTHFGNSYPAAITEAQVKQIAGPPTKP